MATKVGGLDHPQVTTRRFGAFFIAMTYVHTGLPYCLIVHFTLHRYISDPFYCLGT